MSATGWWMWALCLAVSATVTTNPWLLLLLLAVLGCVVAGCAPERSAAQGSTPYGVFIRIGLVILLIRVAFQILLGGRVGHTLLFTLPTVHLPAWMTGIQIGGAVTAEGVLAAVYDGLGLATLLIAFGAAHTLGSVKRVLAHAPTVLYELSVAVVIALTTLPQLVTSAREIHQARTLRGDTTTGVRAFRRILAPLLTDTLQRGAGLAASMESRGYGTLRLSDQSFPRLAHLCLVTGSLAMLVGVLGALGLGVSSVVSAVSTLIGLVGVIAGVLLQRRSRLRTQYRSEKLTPTGWVAVASGAAALLSVVLTKANVLPGGAALTPPATAAAPDLPLWAAVGVCIAVLPVFLRGMRAT